MISRATEDSDDPSLKSPYLVIAGSQNDRSNRNPKKAPMTRPHEHAQLLRAIGQALEVLEFGSFTMELTGQDFLVRGSAITSAEQEEARAIRGRIIKFVWGGLP